MNVWMSRLVWNQICANEPQNTLLTGGGPWWMADDGRWHTVNILPDHVTPDNCPPLKTQRVHKFTVEVSFEPKYEKDFEIEEEIARFCKEIKNCLTLQPCVPATLDAKDPAHIFPNRYTVSVYWSQFKNEQGVCDSF